MSDKPDYPKGLHANTAYEFLVRGFGFLKAEAEDGKHKDDELQIAVDFLEVAIMFAGYYLKKTDFEIEVIDISKPIEGTPYEGTPYEGESAK